MSDDIGSDPYVAVLTDLRAKRDRIDEAITLIRVAARWRTARQQDRETAAQMDPVDETGSFSA